MRGRGGSESLRAQPHGHRAARGCSRVQADHPGAEVSEALLQGGQPCLRGPCPHWEGSARAGIGFRRVSHVTIVITPRRFSGGPLESLFMPEVGGSLAVLGRSVTERLRLTDMLACAFPYVILTDVVSCLIPTVTLSVQRRALVPRHPLTEDSALARTRSATWACLRVSMLQRDLREPVGCWLLPPAVTTC